MQTKDALSLLILTVGINVKFLFNNPIFLQKTQGMQKLLSVITGHYMNTNIMAKGSDFLSNLFLINEECHQLACCIGI